MNVKLLLLAIILSAVIAAAAIFSTGCAAQNAAPKPALSSPTAHPVAAATTAVAELRKPLFPIFIVALVLVGIFAGLAFVSSLSWVSKIGIPVSAGVCAASLTGIIALPFALWIFGAGVVAVIGFVAYELIRAKGSLGTAVTDAEEDLGLSRGSVSTGGTSTAPASVKPGVSVHN